MNYWDIWRISHLSVLYNTSPATVAVRVPRHRCCVLVIRVTLFSSLVKGFNILRISYNLKPRHYRSLSLSEEPFLTFLLPLIVKLLRLRRKLLPLQSSCNGAAVSGPFYLFFIYYFFLQLFWPSAAPLM